MAVEFVVEDGSGKSDATSYITKAEFTQYWENRGTDYSSLANATLEALLNLSTQYLDSNYRWLGGITDQTQALMWPRYGLYDTKGYVVTNDKIPTELKNALCEIAGYQQENGDLLSINKGVASKRIGPVSVTFSDSQANSDHTVNRIPQAERWLRTFIDYQYKSVRV